MKLGEIVVHMAKYKSTKFHQNQMKNEKVLLIARFSAQNIKVSVESRKSYIVQSCDDTFDGIFSSNLKIHIVYNCRKDAVSRYFHLGPVFTCNKRGENT